MQSGCRFADKAQNTAASRLQADASSCRSTLAANDKLEAGDSICSPSQEFTATIQKDGNWVIYRTIDQERTAVWATMAFGDHSIKLQSDCNLVKLNKDKKIVWSSGSVQSENNSGGCFLEMQDDGILAIRKLDRSLIWSSDSQPSLKIAAAYRPLNQDRNSAKQEICACINNFLPGGKLFQTGTAKSLLANIDHDDWFADCVSSKFKEEEGLPAPLPKWYKDFVSLVGVARALRVSWDPLNKAILVMNGLECSTRSVSMIDKLMREAALAPPASVLECRENGGQLKWSYHYAQYNHRQKNVLEWLCSRNDNLRRGEQGKTCRDACKTEFDNGIKLLPKEFGPCLESCTEWCSDATKGQSACEALRKK
jgi:hypothetical protein